MRPRRLWSCVVAAMTLLMAGCAKHAPQDFIHQTHGPVARTDNHLLWMTLWVAIVVFFFVEGLLLFAVIRHRDRGDDGPLPVQTHGNTRLEIGWTIAPALILLVLAIPTVATMVRLARPPKNALKVTVVGHQFWWEYRYASPVGVVTANELHIPVHRKVELTLRGVDVIHSFWVPKLGGKHDVEPGRVSKITYEADKPGTYFGQCVEFCGLSHANMRLRAVAQTPEDFDAWVANQHQGPPTPADGTPAADGFALFTAKGCAGCHTINGISAGNVGPNLTHVYARQCFAGCEFDMSPENLRTWLHNPPGVKPGSKMPNLQLSGDEITKLVAYLETLK